MVGPFPEVEEIDDEGEEEGEEEETAEELEEEWAECEELEGGEEQEACEEEIEELEEQEELEECTLSETDSTVVASAATDTLRVAVRYRAYEAGKVGVQYQLHGGKGSLKLDRRTDRFGRHGVFHDVRHLSEAQMTKVLAAHQLTVEMRAAGSPSFCEGLFDERLSVRHSGDSARVWADPAGMRQPSLG
jgi:cobalamin biosynthesis protein CobT